MGQGSGWRVPERLSQPHSSQAPGPGQSSLSGDPAEDGVGQGAWERGNLEFESWLQSATQTCLVYTSSPS